MKSYRFLLTKFMRCTMIYNDLHNFYLILTNFQNLDLFNLATLIQIRVTRLFVYEEAFYDRFEYLYL